MRAIQRFLYTALALVATVSLVSAQDQIPWQTSLDAAQQLAAKSNRLVLVHFWSATCQPCARVDKEVFSRAEVARALEANFVMVKLNWEDAPGTARMYGVTSVPTDVVIAPNGRLVALIQSPQNANQYVAEMNQAAESHRELARRTLAPAISQTYTAPANGYATPPSTPPIDVSATNRATPTTAVTQASTPASGPAAAPNASAPPVSQQAYSSDRYSEYFKQHPQAAAPTGAPAANPPLTVNPYVGASAPASSNAAPPQTAAAPAGMAAPAYAPGSIAGAYPQTAAAAPQAAPIYQQPPPQAPAMAAQATGNLQSTRPNVQLPPGAPPLGFDGFCAVSLTERNQWVPGEKTWGVVHRGRTYLFAGPEEQKKFWANPDLYSPVLSGNDPVLALDNQMTVPGKREFGVFYNSRIYLFADEASLQRFEKNTNRYAAEVLQAMR